MTEEGYYVEVFVGDRDTSSLISGNLRDVANPWKGSSNRVNDISQTL